MKYEEEHPEPRFLDDLRWPDQSYEANELSTHAGTASDPAESIAYYDRISQRSAGWFRHS